MRGRATAFALLGLVVSASCGGSDSSSPRVYAPPATAELGWREVAPLARGHLVFGVKRLVVGRARWAVEASIENRTPSTFVIMRPHEPGGASMGLVFFSSGTRKELGERIRSRGADPPLTADRFVPALPRVLRPGAVWRGTFSGRGRVPAGQYVRVHFGEFANPTHRPDLFSWITDHALRL